MKILLDGNVYNKIEGNLSLIKMINKLSGDGAIEIVCNQVVLRELEKSRFLGIPDWFMVTKCNEPGAFIGLAIIAPNGSENGFKKYAKIMPNNSTYSEHVGISKKKSDGIIADTSSRECDVVVSEDNRFINRLNEIQRKCKGMNFAEFCTIIIKLHS